MTEESLFELVVNTPESERAALLDRECAGDPALKTRLEALIRAHERTLPFGPPESEAGSSPSSAQSLGMETPGEVGQVIAGRYTLIEVIGEGGMGSVWRAKQTEPIKRMVAVKLIKAGMDSRMVLSRFGAERQALALMDHPNIAKILDGGIHQNRPYFVMELVKGTPITDFCDVRKLPPKQRLELFVQVCHAIQHAHTKGIIHRDIKPSNVLIALYDDKPVPKVIDFGVAKATGAALSENTIDTGFGGVVGTPQYMSPEQATFNNLDIDTRSDVYGLGVLLYELLAGSPPFSRHELEKQGLLEVLRVIREEEPRRPSTKVSTAEARANISANRGIEPAKLAGMLEGELDWIVMRALEKDRARRYDSANSFAEDVQRYLSGEAVLAHPPSRIYRIRKFLRKYRQTATAVSIGFLTLLAGIIGTTWGLIRAEIARDRAVTAELKAEAEALAAGLERDRTAKERDEKDKARALEQEARRIAQDRLVRSHVRAGRAAMERNEGFNAVHWFNAAWQADRDNPDRDSIHRLRLGAALGQLPQLQSVRLLPGALVETAFSPNGRRVLGYTQASNAVEVWDPKTGVAIFASLSHPSTVRSAEWSTDGKRIVTWANDHALRVWDSETGLLVGQPIQSPGKTPLSAVGLSPDGKVGLIALKGKGMISAVEVSTGNPIGNWKTEGDAISIRFSPKGDRFATTIGDKAILWDPNQVEKVAELPHSGAKMTDFDGVPRLDNPTAARTPVFAPDGRRLVTLLPERSGFAVWDAQTGKPIAKQDRLGKVNGVSISPSGKLILTYSNGTPGEWIFSISELETGKIVKITSGPRAVQNGSFFPDEKSVLYRMSGGDVARAEISSGQTVGPNLRTCGSGLLIPQISPDGRTVLTGDINGIAKVWSLASTQAWTQYDLASGGPWDGSFATRDGRVRIEQQNGLVQVRVGSGKPIELETAPRDARGWLSPDGAYCVLADGKKAYRVWETSTGKPISDWFPGAGNPSWAPFAAFTPDANYLYTFAARGVFECRDVKTWKSVPERDITFKSVGIRTAKLSPDGKWLAVGYFFDGVFIYSVQKPKENPLIIKNTSNVWAIDFSQDSRFVATAAGDLTARVWEVDSGRPAGPSIRNPHAYRDIAFSTDSQSIFTLNFEGQPQIWDWKTGDLIATLPRVVTRDDHRHWFSTDGRFIICKPAPSEAKPVCYPIDRLVLDRQDFPTFLELLTAQRMDETEAILPLGPGETVNRKEDYAKVWLHFQRALANANPRVPVGRSLGNRAQIQEALRPWSVAGKIPLGSMREIQISIFGKPWDAAGVQTFH